MCWAASFVSRKIFLFFNLLQNWQNIASHILCIMKIAQQWTANQGQVLYLTCKYLWLSSKLSAITTALQHFKARGTVGLVKPVTHKCWKITKFSPFKQVILTSGLLDVLRKIWSCRCRTSTNLGFCVLTPFNIRDLAMET